MRAPDLVEEGRLAHYGLFVKRILDFQYEMTGEEFLAKLMDIEEFKPLFELLRHLNPNLVNLVRVLGRERRRLYVVGTEESIIEDMSGASIQLAKGPQSQKVGLQRIYISESI